METTTQNQVTDILNQDTVAQVVNQAEASAEQLANVQDVTIDPSNPLHPEHPEHHRHMSALHAAGLSHSAVGHVHPHHRGIDL